MTSGGALLGSSNTIGYPDDGWGTVNVTGPGSTWTNSGNLTLGSYGRGKLNVSNGGTVSSQNVRAGDSTQLTRPTRRGRSEVNISGSGSSLSATNEILIGAGGWSTTTVTDSGTISAATRVFVGGHGHMMLDAGNIIGDTHISTGGKLTGTGVADGDVSNAGDFMPGNSPGRFDIMGDYTQGTSGTLAIEVGGHTPGTQHDWLAIDGTATIDGALGVELIDIGSGTFSPQLGDSFDVLTATNGVSGEFATQNLPLLSSSLTWHIDYGTNAVTLEVIPLGDMNSDGTLTGLDVDPFVDVLLNGPFDPAADMNQDGAVNGLDVRPLVAAVVSGGASVAAVANVPEPATIVLLAFGSLLLIRRRM